ncbi:hypothetical protein Tco_0760547 [Tanacetum coccineum]
MASLPGTEFNVIEFKGLEISFSALILLHKSFRLRLTSSELVFHLHSFRPSYSSKNVPLKVIGESLKIDGIRLGSYHFR